MYAKFHAFSHQSFVCYNPSAAKNANVRGLFGIKEPMSDTPFWFDHSTSVPSHRGEVNVSGAQIVYETWGEIGNPGVILIHGSNAHLEWWRFTAPFLAEHFRVAALDLSGNGDSGWRKHYSGELFAEEVWAVCQAAELGPHPYVVGHSFGGFIALEVGHQYDQALGGILFMDFTTAPPQEYVEWGARAKREGVKPARKLRIYEDKASAMERFRFLPEQPGVHSAVLHHLAEHSLKEVEGGWTWKFDPTLFDHMEMGLDQRDKFAQLTCKTAVMLGEKSEDEGAYHAQHMLDISEGYLPVVTIPGTYHHMMFDQPIAVTTAISFLLLSWYSQDNAHSMRAALNSVLKENTHD